MEYRKYVKTKETMIILGTKSETTIIKYETNGKIKGFRISKDTI